MAESLSGEDIAKRFLDADKAPGATPSSAPAGAVAPAADLSGEDIAKLYLDADKATVEAKEQAAGPQVSLPQSALGTAAGVVGAVKHGLSFGLDNPLDAATNWLFPNSDFAKMRAAEAPMKAQFKADHPLLNTVGEIAGSIPTYALGEGALRAAVPIAQGGGIVGGGLNILGSAARNAAVSGAQGAGMADDSALEGAKRGAAVGAVVGPAADLIGSGANAVLGRRGAASVSSADAALGKLALDKYGIPITAPDLSSNSLYRIAEDQSGKLPFSGVATADAAKRSAWQGAIAKEMGEPGTTSFTSDVMSRAKGRIGQAFNDVAARTSIPPAETATLTQDLSSIVPQAAQVLTEAEVKPLALQIQNIEDLIAKGNGTISGDAYQALTRTKAPLDLAESSTNPNVRHFAGQIRDALDDAFGRSASPEDQAALAQAKYQYRVMRTIDPLVAGSRDGSITPDAFMQKVLTASRRFDSPTGGKAYTGGGNIGELADIGKLMRAPPQTGTADRLAVNLLAMGATAGPGFVNPLYAAGVPAGLALNRGANMALRSNWLARNLVNSTLNPASTSTSALSPWAVPAANRSFPP